MKAAIQHVPTPDRAAHVADLVDVLQGWADVYVATDQERRGPQWSWRLALASAGQERLMTIQDDVALAAPVSVLEELIVLRPNDILCLCYPRKQAVALHSQGIRWISLKGMWVYGVIYPPGVAADVLAWVTKHIPVEYRHDDRSLSAYLTHHALTAYAPIPSVVQHLEFKSTLGHGNLPQKRGASAVWEHPEDYSRLEAAAHHSKRWTVVDIKRSMGLIP